jgi:hypothetical protein
MFERLGQMAEVVATGVSRRQFLGRLGQAAALAAGALAFFGLPNPAPAGSCTSNADRGQSRCGVCPPGTHCHRVILPGGIPGWACM